MTTYTYLCPRCGWTHAYPSRWKTVLCAGTCWQHHHINTECHEVRTQ